MLVVRVAGVVGGVRRYLNGTLAEQGSSPVGRLPHLPSIC